MDFETPAEHENIALERDDDIAFWTRELGVTRDQLRQAIQNVGNNAQLVRNYVRQHLVRHRTHER